MTRSNSFLHIPFVSMTLIAGAALAAGCVDSAEPTADSVENALVNQPGSLQVDKIGEVRMVGGRVSLATPGWTETSPGIWAGSSKDGAGSIVIGAEGHRVAIAKAERELAALQAEGGSPEAIAQQGALLDDLKAAAQRIATEPPAPLAVTCNINFVIGPSSPLIPGFIGVFAGARLSCSVGTQVFTVMAQACSNLGCGPVATFTPTVSATPVLVGTARAGAAGAACSGAVLVIPPGVSATASGPCG